MYVKERKKTNMTKRNKTQHLNKTNQKVINEVKESRCKKVKTESLLREGSESGCKPDCGLNLVPSTTDRENNRSNETVPPF